MTEKREGLLQGSLDATQYSLAGTLRYLVFYIFIRYQTFSSSLHPVLGTNHNIACEKRASVILRKDEYKNPAYGRHQLSRPVRIEGPIQI